MGVSKENTPKFERESGERISLNGERGERDEHL